MPVQANVRPAPPDGGRLADGQPFECHCPALPTSLGLSADETKRLSACEAGVFYQCDILMGREGSSLALAARAAALGCNRGQARGCELLGHFTVRGLGVAADEAAGLALLKKVCADDAQNCFYLTLDARKQHPEEAYRAAQRGCGARRAIQCDQAGEMIREKEVAGSATEAAAWFESSCALGYQEGCKSLLDMAEKGELGLIDANVLLQRRKRACETGTLKACDSLKEPGFRGNP